ncbi:MAG: M23 family metallopeptidase [Bacteroidales bacterium]|jgi:murein DD-endopeptidase MepM/ murein hydrolase activator NlpD|nr:M23 family metallopeptidase [Bacteroidales bacterium]
MPKRHLFFNPKTLSFEKVKVSFKDMLKKALWFLITTLSFAILIIWLLFYFINSPREKILERENNELRGEIERLDKKLSVMNSALKELQTKDANVYRAIFEINPSEAIKQYDLLYDATAAGPRTHNEAIQLLENINSKTNNIIVRIALESQSLDTLAQLAKRKVDMLASVPAIRPIKNMTQINSGFGYRYHPILKTLRMHTGVDIAAERGTPVYAAADGVVANEGGTSGYGIVVLINHGYSYQTLYAHLSKKAVNPGKRVKRGELIGYVGNTGLSVGPHLHYEVIKNGIKVNPVHYFFNDITPAEYDAILKSSKQVNQSLS